MAKKTEVRLIDDLDGSEAEATFQVSWDGLGVEVELSADNRKRIEETLVPLFNVGQKISVHYGSSGPKGPCLLPLPAPRRSGFRARARAMQASLDYRCGGTPGVGPASRSP